MFFPGKDFIGITSMTAKEVTCHVPSVREVAATLRDKPVASATANILAAAEVMSQSRQLAVNGAIIAVAVIWNIIRDDNLGCSKGMRRDSKDIEDINDILQYYMLDEYLTYETV